MDVKSLNGAYRLDPGTGARINFLNSPVAHRAWRAIGLRDRALLLAGQAGDFQGEIYGLEPRSGAVNQISTLPDGPSGTKFFPLGQSVVGEGGESGIASGVPRHPRHDFRWRGRLPRKSTPL